MKNPKTTITGYLLIFAAIAQIVVHMVSGTYSGITEHIQEIITALAGIGLIVASDGGH